MDSEALEIPRRSLDETIAAHLRDLIVRGELAPGARIRLTDLAVSLDVSTTPLREALKLLADEGLVEWLAGRGVRVAPIRAEETAALFDVLAALEALAAERAAAKLAPAALAALEALHERMREHFQRGERDPYFELNSRIHQQILTLSGNPALLAAHGRLQSRAIRGRFIAIVDDGRWREAMQEHEDLMQAFRRRDSEAAGRIWRLHLIHTGLAVARAQSAETRRDAGAGSG